MESELKNRLARAQAELTFLLGDKLRESLPDNATYALVVSTPDGPGAIVTYAGNVEPQHLASLFEHVAKAARRSVN